MSIQNTRERISEAIKFWEPRRITYNLVLTLVAIGWYFSAGPQVHVHLTLGLFLALAVLAVLANICYCAAYFVDLPLQSMALSQVWRDRRWLLWTAGMIFAVALESYWINDEIFSAM